MPEWGPHILFPRGNSLSRRYGKSDVSGYTNPLRVHLMKFIEEEELISNAVASPVFKLLHFGMQRNSKRTQPHDTRL